MYVDDTTASEIISKGDQSNAQSIVDTAADWSRTNTKTNAAHLICESRKELSVSSHSRGEH